MDKKINIDKWSAGYWFIKNILTKPAHLLYYRKIVIRNAHRIPRGESVILAPNHQNALMDAMVLVLHLNFQSIFLTRADVFKHPVIRRILFFLKMLPIYRIRDGRENMKKNDEIFSICNQILLNKRNPLCIFPEGNHGDKRRLRPLKKGVFQIAFRAQGSYGERPGVKIVPIGLDYDNYYKFGRNLLVNIGHPIEVSEYWNQYEKDPETGTNELKSRLVDAIKGQMIHIETDEYYDLYMGLRPLYRKKMYEKLGLKKDNLENRYKADRTLIDKLDQTLRNAPERIEKLSGKFRMYRDLRDQLKTRDWLFRKPAYSIFGNLLLLLLMSILFPVFLVGFLLNAPVFFLPYRFVKKIRDKQMLSTLSWGIAYGFGLLYYPLLFILALYFLPVWWMKLLAIPLIPLSGILAYRIRNLWIKVQARIKYTLGMKKIEVLRTAYALRQDILADFGKVVS